MPCMSDLPRLIENLLRCGVIASVDHAAAKCRVRVGGLLTPPVPWIEGRAGLARTWWAPSVGEQVMLLCPGGDPARGVALRGLYTDVAGRPDGFGDSAHGVVYDDGAVVVYDPETHLLRATLPGGAKVQIVAPGGIEVTGDTKITGKLHVTEDVTVDAKVTASVDVVSNGISLVKHPHKNVQPGPGLSGEPVAG